MPLSSKSLDMGILVLATYRAAKSEDLNELTAIMSTLRNRALRWGQTYLQIAEKAEVNQGYPAANCPALITPGTGLLAIVESVYDLSAPDFTSNLNFKEGALYFGRPTDEQGTGSWFELNILKEKDAHKLIGTFGTMQFYT
jgi:hypothetical protein